MIKDSIALKINSSLEWTLMVMAARYLDNVKDEFVIRKDSIGLLDVFKDVKERFQSHSRELRMAGKYTKFYNDP